MRRAEAIAAGVILAGSAALLFTRLGRHAFWNDEAYTALLAQSVWRTGDTGAVIGHNLLAFQGGAALENLRHRFDPPLAYYVAAPFLGILGGSAWAGRLPFAFCGLATVALMVRWAWRQSAPPSAWGVLAVALLGNVSLMLFSRQCRYYALAMLLSTALAYLYVHGREAETPRAQRLRWLLAMAALSVCLLATNYINYAAFYACAAADYLAWGRRRCRLARRDLALLFAPQVILGGLIVAVWNPLGKAVVPHESASWLADKATLFWWNLRDLSRCEFGVAALILSAPVLCWATRDAWLLRAFTALLVYVAAATLLSPQPVSVTSFADVRYLVPLVPLCIALGVLCVRALGRRLPAAAVPLAVAAFGTNLLQLGPHLGDPVRSTLAEYLGELARPRTTAYGAAAAWVNANVAEGESVWVLPEYAVSPLMFHAPRAVYAWQLSWPPAEQFRGLPDIHFKDRVPPDVILAFGPVVQPLRRILAAWESRGWRYDQAATLDVYWRDDARPELFWHAFRPVARFDRATEGICIFRLHHGERR
ncbi:MAG TPA: hypothetical protein PLE19_03480 [Planctomycetota bacterium]|nr:hypothetical protein [Planctomycetota bacterium]HRR81170.1 hypothetical protein [Planctomycetota bacterium]HRT95562.1 hypothetical protein [Planctomycetota bacterium]